MGFLELLGIVLIVLKWLGIITWSWFWVLTPLWIGFAIYFDIIILMLSRVGLGFLRGIIRR